MNPELSRPIEADTISETRRTMPVTADETERRRLAGRFGLVAIDRLEAEVWLQRRAGVIHAEGEIVAAVVQSCVVAGDPLPATIEAPFHIRYVSAGLDASAEEEVELSEADCDTLPLDSGRIDIGELVAETLALALDPYPRSPRADEVMQEREAVQAEDASPFAALRSLKDRLG